MPPQSNPPGPGRANTRGLNVRWGADSVYNISPCQEQNKDRDGKSRAQSEERPRTLAANERNKDGKAPVRGVGGRRYAAEGMAGWR